MNSEQLLEKLQTEAYWLDWELVCEEEYNPPTCVATLGEEELFVYWRRDRIWNGPHYRYEETYTAERFVGDDRKARRTNTSLWHAIYGVGGPFGRRVFFSAEDLALECAQILPGEWKAFPCGIVAHCESAVVAKFEDVWAVSHPALPMLAFGLTPAEALANTTAALRKMCGMFWPNKSSPREP